MTRIEERDRDALEMALDLCRRIGGPHRSEQLDAMLRERSWITVAEFAAYLCQGKSLHLKPWQETPCHVDEKAPRPGEETAVRILRALLRAGISRWHPDPLEAMERAADAVATRR
jgi:hypothetical protein